MTDEVTTLEPTIKEYPDFGELTIGISDPTMISFTALCMLNDPQINQFLLDNKLRMSDRVTKTKIFPREGMALPEGIYTEPTENTNES